MAYVVITPIIVTIGLLIAYFLPDPPQYGYGDENEKEYQRMMETARKFNIK